MGSLREKKQLKNIIVTEEGLDDWLAQSLGLDLNNLNGVKLYKYPKAI